MPVALTAPPDKTLALVAEMDDLNAGGGDGPVVYTCPMHPEVVAPDTLVAGVPAKVKKQLPREAPESGAATARGPVNSTAMAVPRGM